MCWIPLGFKVLQLDVTVVQQPPEEPVWGHR
jgi:hypothetical protein